MPSLHGDAQAPGKQCLSHSFATMCNHVGEKLIHKQTQKELERRMKKHISSLEQKLTGSIVPRPLLEAYFGDLHNRSVERYKLFGRKLQQPISSEK